MILQVDVLQLLSVIDLSEEGGLISENQDVKLFELVPPERLTSARGVSALLNIVHFEIVFEYKQRQIQIEVEKNRSNFVVLDAILYKNK